MSPQNTEPDGNVENGEEATRGNIIHYRFVNCFLRMILTFGRAAFIFRTLSREGDPEQEKGL